MASVVEQSPFNLYVGNGVTTVFPYEFTLLSAGDMVVSIDGVVVPDSNYTLTGVGVQAGGTVTFLTPPGASTAVLLSREIALARSTDYQVNGDLPADVVDLDFNRLWQALQGLSAQLGGVLRLPYPEQTQQLPTAQNRALRLLGADANGDIIFTLPGDATELALDLLNIVNAAKGPALVGMNPALTYPAGSLGKFLTDLLASTNFAAPPPLGLTTPNAVNGTTGLFTGSFGYTTGAGGTVTQATSKFTSVTLNKTTGAITLNNQALAAGAVASFIFNNLTIGEYDQLLAVVDAGAVDAGAYNVWAGFFGTGACRVYVKNISGGSLSEAIVINYVVIKGSAS